MPHHTSLRQHLLAQAERGHEPAFVASHDEPLVEFAKIFADAGVYSLDVNKHRPDDEFWTAYELTAETVRAAGDEPEIFQGQWSPGDPGQDLAEGFLAGSSSALFGAVPGGAMPPSELMSALLLLVTTNFVHLSASREQDPPVVRGAVDLAGDRFGYVVLDSP
jgi:hypothetical protein